MSIFKNKYKQIRSGWKITAVFISFIITTFIVSFIFSSIYIFTRNQEILSGQGNGNDIAKQFLSMTSFPGAFLSLTQCIIMILFVILFWRRWDKKKIKEIGLINIKSGWRDLLIGLLSGAASFIIVAVVLIFTKSVELQNDLSKPHFSMALIIELIIFIFVGINEELFARGYCMTVLKQSRISWMPILVSSIIFSLMHSMNEGISLLAYTNLFLFGIFMGCLFIKTKNIWMCIGYHITWNYFQGDVFGFSVSGNATDSIYTIKTINSNIINGGDFGPEGGLVVTVLLLITIIITYKILPSRG